VPRGREPGGEVRIGAAVIEVLGVAERVVVEPAGTEDGTAVPPPAPQPAPERGDAEAAPAGGHRPARPAVHVNVGVPVLAALLHRRQPPRRDGRPHGSCSTLCPRLEEGDVAG
jgi:hypothetical protein